MYDYNVHVYIILHIITVELLYACCMWLTFNLIKKIGVINMFLKAFNHDLLIFAYHFLAQVSFNIHFF